MQLLRAQTFSRLSIVFGLIALSSCIRTDESVPSSAVDGVNKDLQNLLVTKKVSVILENQPQKVQAAQLIDFKGLKTNHLFASANMLVALKKNGLVVVNNDGTLLSQLKGNYNSLDHRIVETKMVVASVEENTQQALAYFLDINNNAWSSPLTIPKPNFKIDNLCLYQDTAKHQFVFLIGEEGLGEQWLVAKNTTLLPEAHLVRKLSLPPNSQYCAVDDVSNTLYVNEENVGVWAYAAGAEAELSRQAVAMIKPFGNIAKSVTGIALAQSKLLMIDSKSHLLHQLSLTDSILESVMLLSQLKTPEKISARVNQNKIDILIQDKSGIHLAKLTIGQILNTESIKRALHLQDVASIPEVQPLIQTDPIPSLGDAADDPAIWVHPADVNKSLVLGTDKQGGLAVYDLKGKERQYLPVGRLNNVDIRTAFNLNGEMVDLALASNRDNNSLHIFSINRNTGRLSSLGEQATNIEDIYGFCMFKDKKNRFYAIVNDKNGQFSQYHLTTFERHIKAALVREFKVATQPEGCVADDESEQLFVGEEGVAVWALNANGDATTTMSKVIGVNTEVHADIEGIAYYRGKQQQYLVISSQGNDSYVVLEAKAPYRYRGNFRIGINARSAIDGTSETDGLEVTSADLSGNNTGVWRLGMLVVQDGRKRMPVGRQNFKYVPWTAIADILNLE
jgi:3-phytase